MAPRNIVGLTNPRGFIPVDKHQRNSAFPKVFAIGVGVAIPPIQPALVPVGMSRTGFMIESVVTATALNIAALVEGREPREVASWNATCLADFGVVFVAQPQIPPRNMNRATSGKWVHYAKIGFEKYFLHKLRVGKSEPFFEHLMIKALGIDKVKDTLTE